MAMFVAAIALGGMSGMGGTGCAAKKRDLKAAKASAYDTDFAIVFSEVIRVVEATYPQYDDDPVRGVVKTAWHQVDFNASMDDPNTSQIRARASGGANNAATSPGLGNQTDFRKKYFVRFDIKIVAPRPFEISITPHAAEWDPGNAVPTEMKSNNIPPWLPGRTDALRLKLYRALKSYAVAKRGDIKAPAEVEDPLAGEVARLALDGLPQAGAEVVRAAFRAALGRDARALRAIMAEAFAWDSRSAPGADTAIVVWQADPSHLAALERDLRGGCALAGDRITCGHAIFALSAGAWQFAEFVEVP